MFRFPSPIAKPDTGCIFPRTGRKLDRNTNIRPHPLYRHQRKALKRTYRILRFRHRTRVRLSQNNRNHAFLPPVQSRNLRAILRFIRQSRTYGFTPAIHRLPQQRTAAYRTRKITPCPGRRIPPKKARIRIIPRMAQNFRTTNTTRP